MTIDDLLHLSLPAMWPHQLRAYDEVRDAHRGGWNRVVLTIPTGGGKTRVICELVANWLAEGLKVVVYTNRRMLVDQLRRVLTAAGFQFGVRAAGAKDERDLPLQVSSIQTEIARVYNRDMGAWALHEADRYVIDECHLMNGEYVEKIMEDHREQGALGLGTTATPIDLFRLWDKLIVAGTTSELRDCGALVMADQFGVGEPDLRHVKRLKLGEDLSEGQNRKAMMTQSILGETIKHYRRLNPEQKPALLFAPGVKESVWFAEQFTHNGIRSASIDGADIWLDGKLYKTDTKARQEVLDLSEAGDVKVVCNRFVLREGVDMPWVEHGIFACVFGSLQTFLQSGGRLLRASPKTGKKLAVVQDHGGNWHRHGSLNADRDWDLCMNPAMAAGMRLDKWLHPKRGERPPPQPSCCPKCCRVLNGLKCPCGFNIEPGKKSRPVVEIDGSLSLVEGDIYHPIRTTFKPDTHTKWEKIFWRARASGMTFRAAEGLFYTENRYYPPRDLPLMPRNDRDWYREVADVPFQALVPRPEK